MIFTWAHVKCWQVGSPHGVYWPGILITVIKDLGEEKGRETREECEQRSMEKQHGRWGRNNK